MKGDHLDDSEPYREFLDPEGRLEHGLGEFLVRSGDQMTLIDCGVGPNQVGPYGPYNRVIRGGELPVLEERLETFDHDGPLLPGIDARLAPGHTPGSVILVLSSGQSRRILLGDVVHCPVELVDDEWGSLGDVDPEAWR